MIISHPLILAFYDIPLEGLAPDDSFCQLENYHLMGKVRQQINLQNYKRKATRIRAGGGAAPARGGQGPAELLNRDKKAAAAQLCSGEGSARRRSAVREEGWGDSERTSRRKVTAAVPLAGCHPLSIQRPLHMLPFSVHKSQPSS